MVEWKDYEGFSKWYMSNILEILGDEDCKIECYLPTKFGKDYSKEVMIYIKRDSSSQIIRLDINYYDISMDITCYDDDGEAGFEMGFEKLENLINTTKIYKQSLELRVKEYDK